MAKQSIDNQREQLFKLLSSVYEKGNTGATLEELIEDLKEGLLEVVPSHSRILSNEKGC